MNRTSDFRQKEVININDGKRLGFVCDVEINLKSGRVRVYCDSWGKQIIWNY